MLLVKESRQSGPGVWGEKDRGTLGHGDRRDSRLRLLNKLVPAFAAGVMAAWLNRGLVLANGDDIHFGDLSVSSLAILIVAGVVAALALGLFILRWVQSPGSAPDSKVDEPQGSDDETEG